MRIWIDADACPRMTKEVVYKTALRLKLPVTLVANSPMAIPRSDRVTLAVVAQGPDVADRHILQHASPEDLVITADIPLAAELVRGGILAIDPRGRVYTEANVGEALATRDLMQDLRDGGMMGGGPPPLTARDREQFTNALDRELTRLRRRHG